MILCILLYSEFLTMCGSFKSDFIIIRRLYDLRRKLRTLVRLGNSDCSVSLHSNSWIDQFCYAKEEYLRSCSTTVFVQSFRSIPRSPPGRTSRATWHDGQAPPGPSMACAILLEGAHVRKPHQVDHHRREESQPFTIAKSNSAEPIRTSNGSRFPSRQLPRTDQFSSHQSPPRGCNHPRSWCVPD